MNRGQSMFELLVAVFVVGITLVALVALAARSIGNTTFSRERTQVSKYTQEAAEWLRAERDAGWGVFRARANGGSMSYCLPSLSWTVGCTPIAGTNFSREVEITEESLETVRADVVVSWSDSSGAHESRVTTYFTNWRTR
jgi:hypothetical protein